MTLGAYALTFVGAERIVEPHRESTRARVDISKNGRSLGALYPSMNQYENQREPVGSPAVHTSLTEDLYLSVHNIDPGAGTVGLLVLVNPMVCWIWIATAVMALGGLMALVPSLRGAALSVRAPAPASIAIEGANR
jgi:cytochrome c-type biogenesis protein CcmF